jgi:FAD dependent oxidoreductase
MSAGELEVDVLIFGGGVAGLWLLDDRCAAGVSCLLLEADALGAGQTVASQGIIHGGLKYTLDGLFNPSAEAIRQMPGVWRACLAGQRRPNLSATPVRSPCCYLWRTASIKSRLGMVGAKKGLVVAPVAVADDERPAALAGCPGDVLRLDEQVISPAGFLADLGGQHAEHILKIDAAHGVSFDCPTPGRVQTIALKHGSETLKLRPRYVVFTAGEGNAEMRRRVGLPDDAMQRRPLHVAMVRGDLPELFGHCVDGAKTRVTVTSDRDSVGRTVWQLGGQVTEDGVNMSPSELIAHARKELQACLPGLELSGAADLNFRGGLEWATFRIDRAEPATADGRRPADAFAKLEGNVITAWPTKLALAPQLAQRVRELMPDIGEAFFATGSPLPVKDAANITDSGLPVASDAGTSVPAIWPRPEPALPPWERTSEWTRDR